jgi:hypothetical protein
MEVAIPVPGDFGRSHRRNGLRIKGRSSHRSSSGLRIKVRRHSGL